MSFSLDTHRTKYLPDYAAALRHHDSIKPIRNSNTRPIAERTKQHFNIRTEGVGGHLAKVVVRLHNTDIITYTPDNRVTLNVGGYNSISTRAAIRAVAGVTMDGNAPLWVQDYDHKYYLYKDNMQLEVQGYCTLKIIDPTYPVIHTLNKKAMNALRKDYAPFINYLRGFIKLIGEDGFTDEMLKDVACCMLHYRALELAKGTHDHRHEMALVIVKAARNGTRYGNPLVRLKDALTCFDRHLIRGHRDTVLTRSTVTDGRMVKDRYTWVK
jgi:hypothetical protein